MKIRSFVVLLLTVAVGLAVAACGNSPTSASNVSTVVVSGVAPGVGQSSQFSAVATLAGGVSEDVTGSATWSSSNTAVASVSATGTVTSLAAGAAVISATFSGVAGSDSITVP